MSKMGKINVIYLNTKKRYTKHENYNPKEIKINEDNLNFLNWYMESALKCNKLTNEEKFYSISILIGRFLQVNNDKLDMLNPKNQKLLHKLSDQRDSTILRLDSLLDSIKSLK